jgi:anti-anti-sigma factor
MTLDQQTRVLFYRDGRSAHARLTGAVNRETVPAFQERLDEIAAGGFTAVTLDLGAAEYLDSDGIRWLQRLQEQLAARGATLRLALREGCRAERTLQLVRLDNAFLVERYPSERATSQTLP